MTRHIIISVLIGFGATILTWGVKAESSPFYRYFFEQRSFADIWSKLQFPILMIAVVTGISSPAFMLFLIFCQWFLLSLFVCWFVDRKRGPIVA
jgi:hypothetical protein